MAFDVNSMSSNTSFDAALNRMANRVAGFEEEQAKLAESHTTGAANAAVAGGMLAKLDWGNPLALMQELEKQYSQLAQLANSAKRFQDNILSWADKVPMPQFSMGDAGTAQAPMAPVANAGPQIKAHTKIDERKPKPDKPGDDAAKGADKAEKKEDAGAAKKKEPLTPEDITKLADTIKDKKYDEAEQKFLLEKIQTKFEDDKVAAQRVAEELPADLNEGDESEWGNAFGLWLGENFHDLSEDQAKFATGEIAFQDNADAKFLELESPDVEFDKDENAKYTYKVSDSHDVAKVAKGDKVFKRGDEWFKDDGSENGKRMNGVQDFDHGSLYFEKGSPIPQFLSPKAYFEGFESDKDLLAKIKAQKSSDDLLGEKWVEEAKLLTSSPKIRDKLKFEYTKADGEKPAKLDVHFSKADKPAVLTWLDNLVSSDDAGSDSQLSALARNFQGKNVEMWLNGKHKVGGFTSNAAKALLELVKDEEGEDAAAPAPAPTPAASVVAADATPVVAVNHALQRAGSEVVDVSKSEGTIAKWKSSFPGLEQSFAEAKDAQGAADELLMMASIVVGLRKHKVDDLKSYEDKLKTHVAEFQKKYPDDNEKLQAALDANGDGKLVVAFEAEKPAAPAVAQSAAAANPVPQVVVSGPDAPTIEAAPVADDMDFSDAATWEPSDADKKLKAEFDVLAGQYERAAKKYHELLDFAELNDKDRKFVDSHAAKTDYDKVMTRVRSEANSYQNADGYSAWCVEFKQNQQELAAKYNLIEGITFEVAETIPPEQKLLESYTKIAKAFDDPKATQVDLKAKLDLLDAMRNQLKLAVEGADARVLIGGVEYMKRDLKSLDVANKIQTLYTDALIKYSGKFGVPAPSASLDTSTEFTVGALSPEDLAKKLHGSFS